MPLPSHSYDPTHRAAANLDLAFDRGAFRSRLQSAEAEEGAILQSLDCPEAGVVGDLGGALALNECANLVSAGDREEELHHLRIAAHGKVRLYVSLTPFAQVQAIRGEHALSDSAVGQRRERDRSARRCSPRA